MYGIGGHEGEPELQRLFSTFPGGAPGLGLLLLRAMVGWMLVIQSLAYFSNYHTGPANWIIAALAIVCAIFFLLGLFTPIVSLFGTVGVVGSALSWFSPPAKSFFCHNLMTIDTLVSSVAILLLGPGAFSVDARLFGRREIIIPRPGKLTKS